MDTEKSWKYCYWLTRDIFEKLAAFLEAKGFEMARAKQNPCEVMLAEIGYAEPAIWPMICRFDAAPWYTASQHAGKYLVVSSQAFDAPFCDFLETTIEPVEFEPPCIPSPEEHKKLAADPAYQARQPDGWGAFPKEMGEAIVNGLGKVFGTKIAQFEDLLQTWTAVHANFACPVYRSGEAFGNVPYSIADSVHMSTCCAEMFNLIDTREKALLVRPCIGAVLVKAFERDHYYLVTPVKKEL
jgi:hypothetical protein